MDVKNPTSDNGGPSSPSPPTEPTSQPDLSTIPPVTTQPTQPTTPDPPVTSNLPATTTTTEPTRTPDTTSPEVPTTTTTTTTSTTTSTTSTYSPDPVTTTQQPTTDESHPTRTRTHDTTPNPVQPTTDNTRPASTGRPTPSSTMVTIVTVTRSGGAIVTITETSYSIYEPTDVPGATSLPNSTEPKSDSKPAIIGGVVGAVAFVALIGLFAFLMLRRRKKKQAFDDVIDPFGGPYTDAPARHSVGPAGGASPRHLVAPPKADGCVDEPKYSPYPVMSAEHSIASGGYYEDVSPPYPPTSTSYGHPNAHQPMEVYPPPPNYGQFRHVPNEVDYPMEERHKPHLVENDLPHVRS
ncbi:hypothetical protein DFQ28_004472 [Apophysomyces sp. BC1034]|nr:hypothetical protein DFQ30_002713 [Apophysomyces sp. BC1015]KAG0182875.1 hypothetical protein DFQ29_001574 [Apophysomyces sp. BC1021]KAG0193580.1 hypothetical protein DFQ28_004472 [Apophysomyces sp. BC1034]